MAKRRGTGKGKAVTAAVLGTGSWGTALALALARNGHDVRLWGVHDKTVRAIAAKRENKFLPGIEIPASIQLTSDVGEALDGCAFWINAVPTAYIRDVMKAQGDRIPASIPVVNSSKGIENGTLLRASQVITNALGRRTMAMLAGPSHAEEVARRAPTSVVVGSRSKPLAEMVQAAFQARDFRVYTNTDIVGVEMGGALKNVIAIGAGICDGLGFGDNAKAALITRGIAEISRLGAALGARKSTFSGLSGIGDLIVTCTSRFGRNRAVGEAIGGGKTLKQVLAEMQMVAEGVWTTRSTVALAKRHDVEMPISDEVFKVLFRNKKPAKAVTDLMQRQMKAEGIG